MSENWQQSEICIVINDECDNDDDVDEVRNDENVDNVIQGHPNDEMNRADGCMTDKFDTVCNSTVSVLTSQNQSRSGCNRSFWFKYHR